MKVIGLISGGKDSIYNLMECVRHGHEIVALANLHPVDVKTGMSLRRQWLSCSFPYALHMCYSFVCGMRAAEAGGTANARHRHATPLFVPYILCAPTHIVCSLQLLAYELASLTHLGVICTISSFSCVARFPPTFHHSDELDSYMYQTVGHNVIEAVAECMGLPLFRKPIKGSAVTQELEYQPTEKDEVEDMYELLAEIKVYTSNGSRCVLCYERGIAFLCAKLCLTGTLAQR